MSCNAVLREGSKTAICERELVGHEGRCKGLLTPGGAVVEWDQEQWSTEPTSPT